jgi:hypothetical protein
LPSDVDVLNVNLPAGVRRDTPAVVTRVGRSRYLECFKRVEAGVAGAAAGAAGKGADEGGGAKGAFVATFKHAPSGMSWEDVEEGSDTWAVKSGRISISAVTLQGVCSAGAAAGAGPGVPGAEDVSLSWLGWGCTCPIQCTHSLKPPGFNPSTACEVKKTVSKLAFTIIRLAPLHRGAAARRARARLSRSPSPRGCREARQVCACRLFSLSRRVCVVGLRVCRLLSLLRRVFGCHRIYNKINIHISYQ